MPTKTKSLFPINVTSDLRIKNYNDLLQESKAIEAKYKGYIGTERDCRALKRRINRLSRQLNDLRKAKAKPYRQMLKQFKSNIDTLREHIGNVTKALNKQINVYKQRDLDKLKHKFQLDWNTICASRHLSETPIPDSAFTKKTMSKKDRLNEMIGAADLVRNRQQIEQARVLHGKPVNVNLDTGEIEPIPNAEAHQMMFIGTHVQFMALQKFVKQNHIRLNTNNKND